MNDDDNNYVMADQLSCQGQAIGTERSLHPLVCERLLRVWGKDWWWICWPLYSRSNFPSVGLLSSPMFWKEDTFQQTFDHLVDIYAFPPFTGPFRLISFGLRMTLVSFPQQ